MGEKVCSSMRRLKNCLELVSRKTGKNFMGRTLDRRELTAVLAGKAENEEWYRGG